MIIQEQLSSENIQNTGQNPLQVQFSSEVVQEREISPERKLNLKDYMAHIGFEENGDSEISDSQSESKRSKGRSKNEGKKKMTPDFPSRSYSPTNQKPFKFVEKSAEFKLEIFSVPSTN